MSAMYNNFILMYINLFQKGYLANVLASKTKYSCLEFLNKRWLRIYAWMGKTNLKNLAKNSKKKSKKTWSLASP